MSTKMGITKRSEDYSQWYLDIIRIADLAEYSGVKGCMVIKPYGYAIWENFQKILDIKIKDTGHQNVYFPLLIPKSLLEKEKAHIEGFAPELAVVTHAGGKELKEPLVIRPTSETVIYEAFSRWIKSWRDLPILINQWVNVVRWEMRPRLFLRTNEFLWQEGHTAHSTEQEAEEEARKMLNIYKDFVENYLAIPIVAGQKSESEKFPGALRTYTIEAMMQDGKALQMGTSHNLGQNFAKVFDVKFTDKSGKERYVWQSSWGVSTRQIGALIMVHSDDTGLVLPPRVAPTQVVIVPIWKTVPQRERVIQRAEIVRARLKEVGYSCKIDKRDYVTPGYKFNEWEKKGVPIRLEVGPRDMEKNQVIIVRRDTGNKSAISFEQVVLEVKKTLEEIQAALYNKAKAFMEKNSYIVDDYNKFREIIEKGGFVYSGWCGSKECESQISKETKATIRCIPFDKKQEGGRCIKCGKVSRQRVVFARAY